MWVVTCAVRQLCAAINYDRDAKHHYSCNETVVFMYSEVRRHVFCDVTELELWRKVASWPHTTDLLIHSKCIFFNGIMLFCIPVIFDVSAQLGRLLTSRFSSRLINKSSTKSWLSTPLTKYWHFAPMSETIFRLLQLLRTSDFTSREQNVNITLYVFHFMQTCCELPRLHEIPLPGPCRKSHCLSPRNLFKLPHLRYHFRIRVAISSTTQRNETCIT